MSASSELFKPVYMSDKRYDELCGFVRASYPNACVLYIDKVNTPELEKRWEAYKAELVERRGSANEKQLFHGTTGGAVYAICSDGYKSSYNKRAAYGAGTYFSSQGNYSKEYADVTGGGESFMIVNKVLLGKNKGSIVGAGEDYDSGGNGSSIYVVKEDRAALPEYVICFHKDAK